MAKGRKALIHCFVADLEGEIKERGNTESAQNDPKNGLAQNAPGRSKMTPKMIAEWYLKQ